MLGSKVFDLMIPTDFFAFHALEILKTFEIRSFSTKNGYFLMFCGSQSHAFSCKHEKHDLLTLVSHYFVTSKSVLILAIVKTKKSSIPSAPLGMVAFGET